MKVSSSSLFLFVITLSFLAEYCLGRDRRHRDRRRTRALKSSKKEKDHNHNDDPGFCNSYVHFLRSDLGGSYRSWSPGTLKYGEEDCNAINQCVGDILVYEPIPVYRDQALTDEVGAYSSTQTMVSVSDTNFITLGNFVIEFNDGMRSELVFSGELDMEESGEGTGAGDFPIVGGIGAYLGVTGEVDILRDLDDPDVVDIKIICI
mmetsp:Transcript_44623/g.50526  ORF Transcript_44623/g.50526 Transcript_44623/m.50526 type:complete len:205 (+) Transcript_44623:206-820(+)|eukprot:CAMPEP_0170926452 /NCGR_PEP_ID=MMETSP0735-20130129/12893_1 /TAXON_ID=186038 /ORGANISM="Fragilariopsis kerguelensis, Strain L26-C5" /LENGTH=204 /DNA_ID=CAMNT_0011326737 /DNA_START=189 /DNA_END=803 /DNA_ORIENTATION=-